VLVKNNSLEHFEVCNRGQIFK